MYVFRRFIVVMLYVSMYYLRYLWRSSGACFCEYFELSVGSTSSIYWKLVSIYLEWSYEHSKPVPIRQTHTTMLYMVLTWFGSHRLNTIRSVIKAICCLQHSTYSLPQTIYIFWSISVACVWAKRIAVPRCNRGTHMLCMSEAQLLSSGYTAEVVIGRQRD